MASSRSSVSLLCVCSLMALLLVANVAVAQADLPQQLPAKAPFTGSRKHLRDDWVQAAKESLESFARRELSDYGGSSSGSNCSGNCKK